MVERDIEKTRSAGRWAQEALQPVYRRLTRTHR
jgi:hypothetical protein